MYLFMCVYVMYACMYVFIYVCVRYVCMYVRGVPIRAQDLIL